MEKTILLWLVGLASLGACRQPQEVAPYQDIEGLHTRFHGKYSLVHSTSSEALDVNLDGKASVNMLEEIANLPQSNIEVRIYGTNPHNAEPSFIFVHQWPKQEFSSTEPGGYVPGLQPVYATKVVIRPFAFDPSITELVLEPQAYMLADSDLYTPLQAVTVQAGDRIQVTFSKRLYTAKGWQIVQIISLSERYTMDT